MPPPPLPSLSFGAAFGDNMVLQQAPAKAAVYGYLDAGATGVTVSVSSGGKVLYTVDATLNTTTQPFGPDFSPTDPPRFFNPWNEPLATWKALLKPTAAGGDYTIAAKCTGCGSVTSAAIGNVAFGDMWYCSGQSNMWLPVSHTYSRNDTVAAIKAGNYTNIRLMAGNSGTDPSYPVGNKDTAAAAAVEVAGKPAHGTWNPSGYGGVNGSNAWMTATQAIATGKERKRHGFPFPPYRIVRTENAWPVSVSSGESDGLTGGDYPLFKMGAACWYFAQRLSELGVSHPIGIANTAIGGQVRKRVFLRCRFILKKTNICQDSLGISIGTAQTKDKNVFSQRIEEYMSNATINTCQKYVVTHPQSSTQALRRCVPTTGVVVLDIVQRAYY